MTTHRTTPYRLHSDEMIEGFNRTLIYTLNTFVSNNKKDWDDHVPYLLMVYRASCHKCTKCSPNLLIVEREISGPLTVVLDRSSETNVICHRLYKPGLKQIMIYFYKNKNNLIF